MEASNYTLYVHNKCEPSRRIIQSVQKSNLKLRTVTYQNNNFPSYINGTPTVADSKSHTLFQGRDAIKLIDTLTSRTLASNEKPLNRPTKTDLKKRSKAAAVPGMVVNLSTTNSRITEEEVQNMLKRRSEIFS